MKTLFVAAIGLTAPILALATPAVAGPRDDVLYGISRCGGIAEDRTWLDCVYGAAQPMRAQLGLAPAPASQQKLVPPAMPGMTAPAAQAFAAAPVQQAAVVKPNFFQRLMSEKDYKAEPPTSLASYKFDAAGHFTVTLANGEVWRQDMGDSTVAHWNKPAKAYPAQVMLRSPSGSRLRIGTEVFAVSKE